MTQLTSLDGTPATRLTFGTMQFGGNADAAASRAMFDACRDAGINHFDTAYNYNNGGSETLLADMIDTDRDSLMIATKAGYIGGSSRVNVLNQFDESRRRLKLDMVDLLYIHRFDPDTPLEETFDTLAHLQAQGAIRFIGVSNYAAWQVMKAQYIATQFETRIDVIQPMYSLVKRQSEVEIIPMCIDQNIEVVPYSPLGGGLLTGKYAAGGTGRLNTDERYATRYGVAWMHETARELAALAAELDVAPATLAVAWAAAHPARPRPIISARSVEQLQPSLAAEHFEMSQDLYDRITALSQTPPPATDRLDDA
ncbi:MULTISPECIES: aldo/keto reductase [Roseobacteraceae]|uniref:L-glyceraldehyde 3-phosphate reductase n=1 Tax=Pseudosulfitobacter pseudonitzschiae TaxID=1402135 RepID=A0A221JWT3_9RHOB|nr:MULTISPECIES: aldo/keto reductase [Roseobacteraceae]ASM71143.1 L-glyceraldehyde 3-phosphate reductase [Pseudosulfitobacter pseudonitzschiae]